MNNKNDFQRALKNFETFKSKLSEIVLKLEGIKNSFNNKKGEFEMLLGNLTVFMDIMYNPDLIISRLKEIEKALVFFKKLGDLSNYPDEIQEFHIDLKKYGPGMFLWEEKKFPHISEINKILNRKLPVLSVRNIEQIVNQYYNLQEKVKSFYPQLYDEELSETLLFFDTEIRPINLINQYPSYKKLDKFLNSESLEDIKRFIENLPEFTKVIQEKGFFNVTNKDIPLKMRNLPKKMERDNKVVSELASDIKSDSDFTVKVLLEQIQTFDSFNINFIKFLIRLCHIFETGKRKYKEHYSINREYTKRKLLKKDLNCKFFDEFEDLMRILLIYLKQFSKVRNICSHRTPKPKLSKNNKYALIYNPKRNNYMKLHIKKTKKFVMTYAYFIRALNI